ncbi:hypothetical protein AVO42_09775 [Thiomicrospira sp. XS5]|uniref:sulfite exporter TauE/SafE family protein n=1 Tax=Thiomicrospira sp. XS5 TaxID=1775636 RepID=UPI0007462793|nr:sulfite exporter TauE/SafE family protein [Thiomicrospira sp. XS5]KUJ75582.1 hypothetical protein AVO42_09775 [Thiomicrospira sp. XS5]
MDISQVVALWPFWSALIVTGVVAGLLAGLLGVGGGIVIVPVLYFIFQQIGMTPMDAMSLATGTSLATIIPTSISSIRAHRQKGNVDTGLIQAWWVFMLLGVLAGSLLVSQVQSEGFIILFALIAMLVAVRMFLHKQSEAAHLPSQLWQRVSATTVGGLSVMAGIGGGTIGVPVLSKFGFASHRAVGTAAAFGLIIALPGAIVMFLFGQAPLSAPFGTVGLVNWPSFLLIVPLTVLFAPLGVKLGQKLPAQTLKKVFAVVLLITGVRMFIQAIGV